MAAGSILTKLFPRSEGAQYWFRAPTGDSLLVCSGLAARNPPQPVNASTTFHCFSTTKPVTALGVLQLAASRSIDLDQPVTRYVPDLPYQNGATVRQVLSHQAGLPSPFPLSWVHADADHATFDSTDFFTRALRAHPTCKPAGGQVVYSNIGFLILGRMIELVSGSPYADYVRARILDVVGCNDGDGYLGFDISHARHATGYTRRWSGLGLLTGLLPDVSHLREHDHEWIRYRPFHLNGAPYGGLKGNAAGWAPLLSAIANRDPRLLPSELYDSFFEPQALTSGRPTGHALAWFTGSCGGYDYRCHAGGGPGYAAEVRIYPQLGAASLLLSNTTRIRDARLLDRLDVAWLPEPGKAPDVAFRES